MQEKCTPSDWHAHVLAAATVIAFASLGVLCAVQMHVHAVISSQASAEAAHAMLPVSPDHHIGTLDR